MLYFDINAKSISCIKERNTTVVSNFISLEKKYDFNYISKLIEENLFVDIVPIGKDIHPFYRIWNILDVDNFDNDFIHIKSFLQKICGYESNDKNNVELYFSFVSKVGEAHKDPEDVFLLNLHGKTMYRIYESLEYKDYQLEKGDLLYIPAGTKHKAFGLTPRTTLSLGYFR